MIYNVASYLESIKGSTPFNIQTATVSLRGTNVNSIGSNNVEIIFQCANAMRFSSLQFPKPTHLGKSENTYSDDV